MEKNGRKKYNEFKVRPLKIRYNRLKSCCFDKKLGMIVSYTCRIDWWKVASKRSS